MIAKALACARCQAALTDAEQVLHGRYDKIDLPVVRPVVTRVERFAGHCRCCGHITLAPVPEGMEEGTPFSVNILALAIYLPAGYYIELGIWKRRMKKQGLPTT